MARKIELTDMTDGLTHTIIRGSRPGTGSEDAKIKDPTITRQIAGE